MHRLRRHSAFALTSLLLLVSLLVPSLHQMSHLGQTNRIPVEAHQHDHDGGWIVQLQTDISCDLCSLIGSIAGIPSDFSVYTGTIRSEVLLEAGDDTLFDPRFVSLGARAPPTSLA